MQLKQVTFRNRVKVPGSEMGFEVLRPSDVTSIIIDKATVTINNNGFAVVVPMENVVSILYDGEKKK